MLALASLALIFAADTAPSPAQLKAAASYSASERGVSYLVSYKGKIIAEEYPGVGRADRTWELASATKSFCGVIALCAQQDGLLTLDEKVSDVITEWKEDSRKAITYRQLLSLVSGIPGGENALAGGKVPSYADAIKIKANRLVGARFQYGPTPFMAFGEALRRKLKGGSVMDYIESKIFKPLNMKHGFWRLDSDKNPHLPSGAHINAREWVKFGEMILNDGKGVLKKGLVKELFIPTKANPAYGMTWWLPTADGFRPDGYRKWNLRSDLPKDIYTAGGAGGQRLYIIPSQSLVVIRQAPVRRQDSFDDGVFLAKLLG